ARRAREQLFEIADRAHAVAFHSCPPGVVYISILQYIRPNVNISRQKTAPRRTRYLSNRWSAGELERLEARPNSALAEIFLDAERLIVLGDALASAGSARRELAGVERDREIGDRRVLGLARTVRSDRGVARLVRHLDRLERLRNGTDLVELDQN